MQYSSPKGKFAAMIHCLSRKPSSKGQIALDDEPNNDKRIKNCEEREEGRSRNIYLGDPQTISAEQDEE